MYGIGAYDWQREQGQCSGRERKRAILQDGDYIIYIEEIFLQRLGKGNCVCDPGSSLMQRAGQSNKVSRVVEKGAAGCKDVRIA